MEIKDESSINLTSFFVDKEHEHSRQNKIQVVCNISFLWASFWILDWHPILIASKTPPVLLHIFFSHHIISRPSPRSHFMAAREAGVRIRSTWTRLSSASVRPSRHFPFSSVRGHRSSHTSMGSGSIRPSQGPAEKECISTVQRACHCSTTLGVRTRPASHVAHSERRGGGSTVLLSTVVSRLR